MSILLESLDKNPQQYCETLDTTSISLFLQKCIQKYEDGEPLINDTLYDSVCDILKKRNPNDIVFKKIGFIDTDDKNKVRLPYHMGSMDKIKEKEGIYKWCDKFRGPYIISEKLDGASAMLIKKNNTLHLFTRGDGTYGKDISHIIPSLNIPPVDQDYCIREELIVSKQNFLKYKQFTTPRSMINGIINKKKTFENDILEDIDLVCFEMINYGVYSNLTMSKQISIMNKLGFITCMNINVVGTDILNFGSKNCIETSFLLKQLLEFRLESNYTIDGLIVRDDHVYRIPDDGNPKYSFAFKSNGLGKITKIKNIEWNISKHSYLIPRIEIDPVTIDGNCIRYTTGFNAKFIKENSLGINSEVRIVRSGDVIPYIIEIISRSDTPLMPVIDYKWTSTMVNIVSVENTTELKQKRIVSFFKTLQIDYVSDGFVKKCIVYGFDTIKKILLATVKDFVGIEGIQDKLATKIHKSIHRITDSPVDISKLMVASLCFGRGFGVKKIDKINQQFNVLKDTITTEMIETVDGFSTTLAKQFIVNLKSFKEFCKELSFIKLSVKKKIQTFLLDKK